MNRLHGAKALCVSTLVADLPKGKRDHFIGRLKFYHVGKKATVALPGKFPNHADLLRN
jgi:hypothetical protein